MIHKIPWFWDVQMGVSDSVVTDGWVGPIGIRLRSVVQWRAILLNLHYRTTEQWPEGDGGRRSSTRMANKCTSIMVTRKTRCTKWFICLLRRRHWCNSVVGDGMAHLEFRTLRNIPTDITYTVMKSWNDNNNLPNRVCRDDYTLLHCRVDASSFGRRVESRKENYFNHCCYCCCFNFASSVTNSSST